MKIFSVYDRAVSAYMPMFPARTVGEAIRMVRDSANREGSQFTRHMQDFTLFEIGEWDDSSGRFTQGVNHPERVIELVELKEEGG